MGVRGLLSYILSRKEQCVEVVDLLEVARQRNGIEILVDFYSFEHLILNNLWKGLYRTTNNGYLRICGGEYKSLDDYLTKFITDLKSLEITLVFFLDATKGSSTEATRQKLDTWYSRHEEDVKRLNAIMDVSRGLTSMADLPDTTSIRPVLLEVQVRHVLSKCGCECIPSTSGEADFLLARALIEREKAYAIFSNDSDFAIFRNCRFIPTDLLDINGDLQLGVSYLPEKPLRLTTGVIIAEKVQQSLKFSSHQLMMEFSIVAGNDFTGQYMNHLRSQLDIRGKWNVENIAGWVRHYKRIENHPILAKEMSRNNNFCSAVSHSRQFYSIEKNPEVPTQKGYLTQLIRESIESGQYCGSIMSMHNNFYWHRMLLEDNTYGLPCVECALAQLRSYIYGMVLPRQESLVNEFGRSPWEPLRKAGIFAADDENIPRIHKINKDQIFRNLKSFHYIITHLEQGNPVNWFDRYGRKNGFIIYILRYFLMLNWNQNLHITENEFLALLAVAFGKPKEVMYQSMVLRPTPRCITIGSWFQDVYRHAYLYLAHLLHIAHEFPTPMEIFSGSAWTAFYTCCKDETFYVGINQVTLEELQKTQGEMNKIIKEKRHMIRYIAEGFFYFDDSGF